MAEKKSNNARHAVLTAAFATALGVGLVLGATTGQAARAQNNNARVQLDAQARHPAPHRGLARLPGEDLGDLRGVLAGAVGPLAVRAVELETGPRNGFGHQAHLRP